MKIVRLILVLLLSIAAVVLSVANRHGVTLSLGVVSVEEVPLYLLMMIIFFMGMLVGGTAATAVRVKKWRQRTKAAKAENSASQSMAADDESTRTNITLAPGPE